MPRDLARDDLYNGQINLWVEDDLTQAYLDALWNDSAVKYLIGGGREGVGAGLKDAEKAGYKNVFGVVDRDHGRSNHADWFVPGRQFRRFILPRHEIENYLLDTPALEGCRFNTHRRTSAEIDQFLNDEAERRCWWAACRYVVSLLRDRFFDRFIQYPTTPPVDTEETAREHIIQSDWFRDLQRKSSGMTETRVIRLLAWVHARASRTRLDGSWRISFSGKEILRGIGNRIFNRALAPRTAPTSAPGFDIDIDLAKSIAAWQVANKAVPADLIDLLAALKARIAPSIPAP
jgi:hypothetical protein